MDSRFDQNFYKSEWQRVLPLGPHGIAPYVHTSRRSRPSARSCLRHLVALLGAVTPRVLAFGRVAASGIVGASGAAGSPAGCAPAARAALTRNC
jgi:hypothetical protein